MIRKVFYDPYAVAKKLNFNIHNSAVLLKSCVFRFDSGIPKNAVSIGSNSMIGCEFIFESDQGRVLIGKDCFINAGTRMISRTSITIGNNVTIAWGCTLYDHNSHSLDYTERRTDIALQLSDHRNGYIFTKSKNWETVKSRPIVVADDVWIGFNVTILSGVIIGEGAVIGAGSVVREDVEPWTVVVGNPAIVVKRLK